MGVWDFNYIHIRRTIRQLAMQVMDEKRLPLISPVGEHELGQVDFSHKCDVSGFHPMEIKVDIDHGKHSKDNHQHLSNMISSSSDLSSSNPEQKPSGLISKIKNSFKSIAPSLPYNNENSAISQLNSKEMTRFLLFQSTD